MKVHIAINGMSKIILVPESEIEKQILASVFIGPVEVTYQEKLQLFDKALVDSYVIAPTTVAKKEEI